ncbi:50S ribosomal protein L16 [Candidatus Micrarchaeota archaeon]|nr:50S ribosomal protein L16 [Candidatus Micrarchaeota archaeon]
MGLRPAKTFRKPDRQPWCRYSRSKPRKSYIKAMPHADLHQFRMGEMKEDFDTQIDLVCKEPIIIRDNAIESARQSSNKRLEKEMAGEYFFMVRPFPHHVIRENKMISGAGADRLQKGMRRSFGRPTDKAAIMEKGKVVFTVYTYKKHAKLVKEALTIAQRKLSGKYRVEVFPSSRTKAS